VSLFLFSAWSFDLSAGDKKFLGKAKIPPTRFLFRLLPVYANETDSPLRRETSSVEREGGMVLVYMLAGRILYLLPFVPRFSGAVASDLFFRLVSPSV